MALFLVIPKHDEVKPQIVNVALVHWLKAMHRSGDLGSIDGQQQLTRSVIKIRQPLEPIWY